MTDFSLNAPVTQWPESRALNPLGEGSNPSGSTKICCTCKLEKSLEDDFHKRSTAKDGRQSSCKKCNTDQAQLWQKNNPTYYLTRSKRNAIARHHLTEEEYVQLLKRFNGKCWACKEQEQNLGIDHDHTCCPGSHSCGRCVRGLLCVQCNTALGLLKDSEDRINSLLRYIKNF